jgi:DNA topoisomerase-1
MGRGVGWTRTGRKGRFRYTDRRGRRISDTEVLERIESLAIPPAWRDVWISPRPGAKLQATGLDSAGRRQYLYHPSFRAAQERAKYEKLLLFGDELPRLRGVMASHMDGDELDRERVSAIALRLIDVGWFRVGSERSARDARTYGITTLTRRHVTVRGNRIRLCFRGKGRAQIRSTLVDDELAAALRDLLQLAGGARVFRYRSDERICNLTSRRLNDYVKAHLGEDFSAKDFRTWGGTLAAAVAFAEHANERGFPSSAAEERRSVGAVMRRVANQLGNTPAVARASYVSPAVIEQYLAGRTIEHYRPRHLRVVGARDIGLAPEEQALLSLLRSTRKDEGRVAA